MSSELCAYCGNFAFGDKDGKPVCLNFAYTGECHNKGIRAAIEEFYKIEAEEAEAAKRAKEVHNVEGRVYGINRNTACPCGSGKKYKNCCLPK